MTLDEAIKHCEEIVADNEEKAEEAFLQEQYKYVDICRKCADEHRQLAEWLKDYKRLLAIEKGIDVRCGNCKHNDTDDGICEECFDYRRWEEM